MSRRWFVAAAVGALLLGVLLGVGILQLVRVDPPPPVVRASDPLTGERPDARPDMPNVVLVIGCTVRRDQTSLYADVAGTTPFLEALAAEGVTFEDVIAAAPWTKAASSAILHSRSSPINRTGPRKSHKSLN